MIRLLFLSLFLIGEVSGDCNCNTQLYNQTYSSTGWPNFWIQNEFDGNTPCLPAAPCPILLIGQPGMGIGDYQQITWDADVTGTIDLYNSYANRSQGSEILTGIVRGDTRSIPPSTGQYVLVVMKLNTAGNVLATMNIVAAGTAVPPVTIPVSTTTTPPYLGNFSINPALISNDLLIMVDQGLNSPQSPTDFLGSKSFAAAVVNKIAPSVVGQNATVAPVTGTRISLNYLNYVNSGAAITPWIDDADVISQQIMTLPSLQSKKTDFYEAINALIKSDTCPFNPSNTGIYTDMNSRNTAQRVLLVIASSPPGPTDKIFTETIDFAKYNIHPIFVAYNFDPSDPTSGNPLTTLNTKGWNVTSVSNFTDSTVSDFVEKYFLTNKHQGTPLCPTPITEFSADATGLVDRTINYGFQTQPGNVNFYTPNYLTNRYCNFQKISYKVKKSEITGKGYCFTVFYELEVEKDTLKFYQCDNIDDTGGNCVEYVSLSGTDVSGTKFCFTNSTRIDFATNESGVYGGFYITFATEDVPSS